MQNELKDFNNPAYNDWIVITPKDNPLECHFTIKGGKGTDYSKGIYHGKILFPENYIIILKEINMKENIKIERKMDLENFIFKWW